VEYKKEENKKNIFLQPIYEKNEKIIYFVGYKTKNTEDKRKKKKDEKKRTRRRNITIETYIRKKIKNILPYSLQKQRKKRKKTKKYNPPNISIKKIKNILYYKTIYIILIILFYIYFFS